MQENVESEVEDRLSLSLKIEEKKSLYKQKRRPILWFIFLEATILIIAILAIIGAFLIRDVFLLGLIAVVFVIGFVVFIVVFFADDAFQGTKRINVLVSLRKDIEDLQTHLRLLEEYQAQQRSPRERYKDELSQVILQYQRQANSYRRAHYFLQILIILFSLFVTALTSGLASLIGFTDKQWITAAVSFAVSFLTAMTALFRFHDRGFNLQQTADAIEYEIKTAELHIYDYSPPLSDEDVLHKLSERGARLMDEQRKRQLQLEQASNTKQTSE